MSQKTQALRKLVERTEETLHSLRTLLNEIEAREAVAGQGLGQPVRVPHVQPHARQQQACPRTGAYDATAQVQPRGRQYQQQCQQRNAGEHQRCQYRVRHGQREWRVGAIGFAGGMHGVLARSRGRSVIEVSLCYRNAAAVKVVTSGRTVHGDTGHLSSNRLQEIP